MNDCPKHGAHSERACQPCVREKFPLTTAALDEYDRTREDRDKLWATRVSMTDWPDRDEWYRQERAASVAVHEAYGRESERFDATLAPKIRKEIGLAFGYYENGVRLAI